MSGLTDLNDILRSLKPKLSDDEFVFISRPDASYGDGANLHPIGSFVEKEGMTLIINRKRADEANECYDGVFRMITLEAHSSLQAVGLTAAVSKALADNNISANVVAAFHHDHIFVPGEKANQAVKALTDLSAAS